MGDGQSVHPTDLLCVPTQAVLVGKTIVAVEALNNATSTPVVQENVVCTLNFTSSHNPKNCIARDKIESLHIFVHI